VLLWRGFTLDDFCNQVRAVAYKENKNKLEKKKCFVFFVSRSVVLFECGGRRQGPADAGPLRKSKAQLSDHFLSARHAVASGTAKRFLSLSLFVSFGIGNF
jgi:hypothetical protein